MDISRGNEVIIQKSAFPASTEGADRAICFQRRLEAGLFGGEGFIMQRLSGEGVAFVELDGHIKGYSLAAGQKLVVSSPTRKICHIKDVTDSRAWKER